MNDLIQKHLATSLRAIKEINHIIEILTIESTNGQYSMCRTMAFVGAVCTTAWIRKQELLSATLFIGTGVAAGVAVGLVTHAICTRRTVKEVLLEVRTLIEDVSSTITNSQAYLGKINFPDKVRTEIVDASSALDEISEALMEIGTAKFQSEFRGMLEDNIHCLLTVTEKLEAVHNSIYQFVLADKESKKVATKK